MKFIRESTIQVYVRTVFRTIFASAQIVFVDQTDEVTKGETLTRVRAPMAQQARLSLFQFERRSQKRVLSQVEHPEA